MTNRNETVAEKAKREQAAEKQRAEADHAKREQAAKDEAAKEAADHDAAVAREAASNTKPNPSGPLAGIGAHRKPLTPDEQAEANKAAARTAPAPSNDARTMTEKAHDAGAPAEFTTEQQDKYAQAQATADHRNVKAYADIVDWWVRTKDGTVNA
jgi:hypothetical protein